MGNFPGVTVDRKDGTIKNHPEATVTDLPGIYSLSPYSSEEIVTRDFLIKDKPSGIINIVDASNLERNLCLTMQLMELGIPMVLALNMMDEVRENGGSIRVNELEQILGIPVIPISAVKNEGIDELVSHALHVARFMEKPGRIDFCTDSVDKKDPVGAVHRCIHAVVHMIEPEAKQSGLPLRFAATKLIENDVPIEKLLNLTDDKKQAFEQIVSVMEDETGLDREAAISNMRFSFIEKMCQKTVVRPHESKEHKRSMKIDRLLTGRYTAIPCFIAIMALIFVMTFNLVGAWLSDLMSLGVDSVISLIDNALTAVQINPVVHSLVVDGICNGVGSVISFLPTIVTLFFFLSILEDTGYMARVAFVMDKLLRKIGLSGRSFVPSSDLMHFHANKIILGAAGVSLRYGVTDHSFVIGSLKREMISRADQVICVADFSKFNQTAANCICPTSNLNVLVTDWLTDDAVCGQYTSAGVRVIKAPEPRSFNL